ncbi:MAG: hypothetical protein AB1758_17435, partial [Candidatus Eremiobacterota bacterium]
MSAVNTAPQKPDPPPAKPTNQGGGDKPDNQVEKDDDDRDVKDSRDVDEADETREDGEEDDIEEPGEADATDISPGAQAMGTNQALGDAWNTVAQGATDVRNWMNDNVGNPLTWTGAALGGVGDAGGWIADQAEAGNAYFNQQGFYGFKAPLAVAHAAGSFVEGTAGGLGDVATYAGESFDPRNWDDRMETATGIVETTLAVGGQVDQATGFLLDQAGTALQQSDNGLVNWLGQGVSALGDTVSDVGEWKVGLVSPEANQTASGLLQTGAHFAVQMDASALRLAGWATGSQDLTRLGDDFQSVANELATPMSQAIETGAGDGMTQIASDPAFYGTSAALQVGAEIVGADAIAVKGLARLARGAEALDTTADIVRVAETGVETMDEVADATRLAETGAETVDEVAETARGVDTGVGELSEGTRAGETLEELAPAPPSRSVQAARDLMGDLDQSFGPAS